MFVGPDSWGDVTEAGLEEAIFVCLLKKEKHLLSYCGIYVIVQILFAFVFRYGNIC